MMQRFALSLLLGSLLIGTTGCASQASASGVAASDGAETPDELSTPAPRHIAPQTVALQYQVAREDYRLLAHLRDDARLIKRQRLSIHRLRNWLALEKRRVARLRAAQAACGSVNP
jgi:hypothetical protein